MTSLPKPKGATYRCPVCGAEVIVLAPCQGCFVPYCCSVLMERKPQHVEFYVCHICGAEIASIDHDSTSNFRPKCCGAAMTAA